MVVLKKLWRWTVELTVLDCYFGMILAMFSTGDWTTLSLSQWDCSVMSLRLFGRQSEGCLVRACMGLARKRPACEKLHWSLYCSSWPSPSSIHPWIEQILSFLTTFIVPAQGYHLPECHLAPPNMICSWANILLNQSKSRITSCCCNVWVLLSRYGSGENRSCWPNISSN